MKSSLNNKPKVLAVIPAKKKSRRLPNKNIKMFNGLPLVCWTVEESIKSKLITNICVSSDSQQTLKIASKYKSVVLVKRPKKLCEPNVDNYKVVEHSLKYTEKEKNIHFDIILLLQPTSPIRSYLHLDQSIKNLWNSKCNTVASVKAIQQKKRCKFKKNKRQNLKTLVLTCKNSRRYRKTFIYIMRQYMVQKGNILTKKRLTSNLEIPIVMNKFYSVDIDDIFDFKTAESYIKYKND